MNTTSIAKQAFDETIRADHEKRNVTNPNIWEGVEYAKNGHVTNCPIENTSINATVSGGGKGTTKYTVTLDNTNGFSASCTCAFHTNRNETCKHISAVAAVAYASLAENPCLCKECLLLHNAESSGHPVKRYLRIDEKNEWEREMFTTFVETTEANKAMHQQIADVIGDNREENEPGIDSLVACLSTGIVMSVAVVTEENLADRIVFKNAKSANSYAKRWCIGDFSEEFVHDFSQINQGDTSAMREFVLENMYKRHGIDVVSV
mgnify:FL=1